MITRPASAIAAVNALLPLTDPARCVFLIQPLERIIDANQDRRGHPTMMLAGALLNEIRTYQRLRRRLN